MPGRLTHLKEIGFRPFGLLGKVVLFTLLPAYCIIGLILLLNHQTVKQAISQKFVEDSLGMAKVIQGWVSMKAVRENPASIKTFLEEVMQVNPNIVEISIYGETDGQVRVLTSTRADRAGEIAAKQEAIPIRTGRAVVEEKRQGDLRLLETISPFIENGRPLGSIGIYTSASGRDILVTTLYRGNMVFAVVGGALILVVVYIVVHRKMVLPLRRLAMGANALAMGRLDYRLKGSGNDEISQLTRSFNLMAQSLESLIAQLHQKTVVIENKNRELETFVYTVSHDLKTPVVSLQGMAGVLQEDYGDKLGEKGGHYLNRLVANADQMEQLIHDLLEISRLGRPSHSPEQIDLNRLVETVLEGCRERFKGRPVEIQVGPLPSVWCDRVRIKQVFDNLITNAFKFLGDQASPRVEIGAIDQEAAHTFWVRDNGIGIDPKFQETIFGVFHRLKDVEVEGTGVGLTIVKRIVEQAGGRIWLESAKGAGTTFYFTWPKRTRLQPIAEAA